MNDIHVKIAEVKIGTPGDMLRTCLGSCVGIVFVWKEKKIFGLAHCFLPEGNDQENPLGAKFVNQGIESLMSLMKIKKSDVAEIEVYMAGGANMMNRLIKTNKGQIGNHNIESATKYLDHHGFKIKKSDLGKDSGIKIIVDCTLGSVEFIRLEKTEFIIWKT
jgi:chemotaxis protein CheD